MRRLLSLSLCLLLALPLAAFGESERTDYFALVIDPEGPTFPLYESASPGAGSLGAFNSGLDAYVEAIEGEQALVRIGGGLERVDGVSGFVPRRYLSEGDRGMLVPALLPVVEVRPADGQSAVPLYRTQGTAGGVSGSLLPGAQVEVLGEVGTQYLVQFGEARGFLSKADAQQTDKQAMYAYGPSPDGFAIVQDNGSTDAWSNEVPIYAYPSAQSVSVAFTWNAQTVTLINDLGEWAQIRTDNGAIGFMETKSLKLYPFADMEAPSGATFAQGTYAVGDDLPPGLYTLDIPEKKQGGIEAIGIDTTLYQAHSATGPATFAMLLTAPASVEISGEAILSPLKLLPYVMPPTSIGWHYAGSGRFFSGVQFLSHWVYNYHIELLPGENVGYYAITNLSQETDRTERPWRTYLNPGEAHDITITPGMFIELRNCEITGMRGNG